MPYRLLTILMLTPWLVIAPESTFGQEVTKLSGSRAALMTRPTYQGTASRAAALSALDYTAIEKLYAQSNTGFDSGAEQGYAFARTFTPDGILAGQTGATVTGRPQLAALAARNQSCLQTWLTNLMIQPSPEGAIGWAYIWHVALVCGSPTGAAVTEATSPVKDAGLYRDVRRAADVTRTIYHRTALLNYGKLKAAICGDPPSSPGVVTATQVLDTLAAIQKIRVSWTASASESSGEADVGLYVVQRRLLSSTDWEPLQNVVAQGLSSYSFDDYAFVSGTWIYGVFAQDCSPSNSAVTAAATAVINP